MDSLNPPWGDYSNPQGNAQYPLPLSVDDMRLTVQAIVIECEQACRAQQKYVEPMDQEGVMISRLQPVSMFPLSPLTSLYILLFAQQMSTPADRLRHHRLPYRSKKARRPGVGRRGPYLTR